MVVRESATNNAVHVVFEKEAKPLYTRGDPAPGGGTFLDVVAGSAATPGKLYVVSPDLVILSTRVLLPNNTFPLRYFRWRKGNLDHLEVPAGALYVLENNDSHGKFLAYREVDAFSREYWITDGVKNSPAIVLKQMSSVVDVFEQQTVVGITVDGAFLINDLRESSTAELWQQDTSVYFRGSRSATIASGTRVQNFAGENFGKSFSASAVNSAGDVVLMEFTANGSLLTHRSRMYLHRPAGGATLVAETTFEFGQFQFDFPRFVTLEGQTIFKAFVPMEEGNQLVGFFIGPTPNDRFGGDFSLGFGQSGTVNSIRSFHETGVMLIEARLTDRTRVPALGFTRVSGLEADTDGDGLPDAWETEGGGIDINGDGIIDLDLFALGARPDRKDLFVEIDATPSARPIRAAALDLVVAAFANAPVNNPDGSTGIRLHLEIDEKEVRPEFGATPNDQLPAGFREVTKPAHFGTLAQRADPNREHLLAAKRRAYRYCIIYNSITFTEGGGYLGIAEIKGNDFVVHIGAKTFHDGFRDTEDQAATFMHELGHTLGLEHGGGVDEVVIVNKSWHGKPNYPSIMNYALAHPYRWSARFWRLDFCREQLPDLNETSLNERAGIPSTLYRNFSMPYGVGPTTQRAMRLARLDGRPIDFNANGFMSSSVSADLNFIGAAADFAGVDRPSPQEVMKGHNDWEAIHYAVVDREGPLAGDVALAEGCPTVEIHDLLDRLVPVEADTYEEWIAAYAEEGPGQVTLTGFSEDPDDDGIPNGIERYFGSNPAEANAAFELVPGAVPPVFRHSRTLSPPADLLASYQWSTDLQNWHASGETAGGVTVHLDPATAEEPGPMGDLVEITPVISGTPQPTLFLRMLVERTSE